MASQGPRKLRKGILTLVVATMLSLVLAEVLFRWLKPEPYSYVTIVAPGGRELPISEIAHYMRHGGSDARSRGGPRARIQPNLHVKFRYDRPSWDYFDEHGSISVDTNSLGFRDLEFPVAKPSGEFRIIAVGDSFTQGVGVQLEDSWPQVLERALAESRAGPVEVINAGFAAGSHYPPGYVEWIKSDALAFEPDLVILGFCLNDMGNVPMLAYPIADPEPPLGGISHLLTYLHKELEQRRLMAEPRDHGDIVRNDPATWQATQSALVQIHEFLAQQGIGFVVAVFPMLSQLDDSYPYSSLHDMVREFCASEGLVHVDLLELFRGRDERDLWAHPTDQHPNHVGNRLIAQGIREFLEQRELVARASRSPVPTSSPGRSDRPPPPSRSPPQRSRSGVATRITKETATLAPEVASYLQEYADLRTWDVLDEQRATGGPSGDLARRVRDPRTGIAFVLVPAGEFEMGGDYPMEQPRHRVRISRPFYMAETEVTAEQWRTWAKQHGGSEGIVLSDAPDDHPAVQVSWSDAKAFTARYGYRLPTEAQWEYACRGPAGSEYWLDLDTLDRHAWSGTNSGGRTHPVATREPNGYGLYDMIGNVWEWCETRYADSYLVDPSTLVVDPPGPETGDHRVVRGGSWFSNPAAHPSDRGGDLPGTRNDFYGFRVIVDPGD